MNCKIKIVNRLGVILLAALLMGGCGSMKSNNKQANL